ncbi:MAG: 4Fe-4S binding protein [Spirochaetia bacterium]|jgi:ferredoxin
MKLEMKVSYAPGDTGAFLRVDESKCNGCGACARFCARGVWQKEGAVYRQEGADDRQEGAIYRPLGLKLCAECGACWNACSQDAVIFTEPRGGTGIRFSFG